MSGAGLGKVRPEQPPGAAKNSFSLELERQLARNQEVKLSAHASKRLEERNIKLLASDLKNIGQAINKAASKGARDCLLLYGDMALITNIPSKTVVTALDGLNREDRVFTNIDSAMVVNPGPDRQGAPGR